MTVVSCSTFLNVHLFNKNITSLHKKFIAFYLHSLASKIEVRLKGQSTDSFSYKQDASYVIDSNNLKSPLKADFLTFATLRPISTLGPFIKHLSDKHIGAIVGKCY